MSFIDKYIDKKIKEDPSLEKEFAQTDLNLNASVIVRNMRDDLEIKKKEFGRDTEKEIYSN